MANLNVSIIARDKMAYQGKAKAVLVPTTTGIIEVLGEHMQLISALAPGEIILKMLGERGEEKFKISGGVIEVRPKSDVVILADLVKDNV